MKPHIKKVMGIWHCAYPVVGRVGIGYSPLQAYDDWLFLSLGAA